MDENRGCENISKYRKKPCFYFILYYNQRAETLERARAHEKTAHSYEKRAAHVKRLIPRVQTLTTLVRTASPNQSQKAKLESLLVADTHILFYL